MFRQIFAPFSRRPVVFPCLMVVIMMLAGTMAVGPARAADAVYTIDNVQVDVTASDAATARNLAFMQAQQAALRQLAVRLAGPAAAARLKAPDDIMLATMVKDYETTAEQLSAVRYLGTYTVRFRGPAARAYFSRQGLGAAMAAVAAGTPPLAAPDATADAGMPATPGKPVLVLPFYQAHGQLTVWGDDNPWLAAWQKLPSGGGGGGAPVLAPIGDAADLADLDGSTLTYERGALDRMAQRYNAGNVMLLVATPQGETAPPTGLDIAVYRTRGDMPQLSHHLTVAAQPGEDDAALYARAALAARTAVASGGSQPNDAGTADMAAGRPPPPHHGDAFTGVPETPAGNAGEGQAATGAGRIHAEAHFAGLSQWLRLQRALRSTDGVSALHVGSLSPQGAAVDFDWRGTPDALRISLTEAGIAAAASGPDSYELHLASDGTGQ